MNTQVTTQLENIQLNQPETRDVQGFERVSLCVQNIQSAVLITQGERESLTISADPDLLSRVKTSIRDGELIIRITGSWSDLIKESLTTSLTRRCIQYNLTVRQLTALDICGITHLEVDSLDADRLALRFRGPGKANFTSLHARSLEVDISGPCKVEASGRVTEQRITIGGVGFYYAPKLESKKAVARINGPGQATIWSIDDLDATISGPGRLEYYGSPRIRRNASPIGGIVSLGKP
jgi:hypothetical protein